VSPAGQVDHVQPVKPVYAATNIFACPANFCGPRHSWIEVTYLLIKIGRIMCLTSSYFITFSVYQIVQLYECMLVM